MSAVDDELPHIWTLDGLRNVAVDGSAFELRRSGALEALAQFPERTEAVDAINAVLYQDVSEELREDAMRLLMTMPTTEATEALKEFNRQAPEARLTGITGSLQAWLEKRDRLSASDFDEDLIGKGRSRAMAKARNSEKRLLKVFRREWEESEAEPLSSVADLAPDGFGVSVEVSPHNQEAAAFQVCVGANMLWYKIGSNSCFGRKKWGTFYGRASSFRMMQTVYEELRKGKYEERLSPAVGGSGRPLAVGRAWLAKWVPDDVASDPDAPAFEDVPADWVRVEYQPYS